MTMNIQEIDHRTTRVVQHETGKRYWSELDVHDRLKVAERCLRDARRDHKEGDRTGALDHLQDARSLIGEARAEVEGVG